MTIFRMFLILYGVQGLMMQGELFGAEELAEGVLRKAEQKTVTATKVVKPRPLPIPPERKAVPAIENLSEEEKKAFVLPQITNAKAQQALEDVKKIKQEQESESTANAQKAKQEAQSKLAALTAAENLVIMTGDSALMGRFNPINARLSNLYSVLQKQKERMGEFQAQYHWGSALEDHVAALAKSDPEAATQLQNNAPKLQLSADQALQEGGDLRIDIEKTQKGIRAEEKNLTEITKEAVAKQPSPAVKEAFGTQIMINATEQKMKSTQVDIDNYKNAMVDLPLWIKEEKAKESKLKPQEGMAKPPESKFESQLKDYQAKIAKRNEELETYRKNLAEYQNTLKGQVEKLSPEDSAEWKALIEKQEAAAQESKEAAMPEEKKLPAVAQIEPLTAYYATQMRSLAAENKEIETEIQAIDKQLTTVTDAPQKLQLTAQKNSLLNRAQHIGNVAQYYKNMTTQISRSLETLLPKVQVAVAQSSPEVALEAQSTIDAMNKALAEQDSIERRQMSLLGKAGSKEEAPLETVERTNMMWELQQKKAAREKEKELLANAEKQLEAIPNFKKPPRPIRVPEITNAIIAQDAITALASKIDENQKEMGTLQTNIKDLQRQLQDPATPEQDKAGLQAQQGLAQNQLQAKQEVAQSYAKDLAEKNQALQDTIRGFSDEEKDVFARSRTLHETEANQQFNQALKEVQKLKKKVEKKSAAAIQKVTEPIQTKIQALNNAKQLIAATGDAALVGKFNEMQSKLLPLYSALQSQNKTMASLQNEYQWGTALEDRIEHLAETDENAAARLRTVAPKTSRPPKQALQELAEVQNAIAKTQKDIANQEKAIPQLLKESGDIFNTRVITLQGEKLKFSAAHPLVRDNLKQANAAKEQLQRAQELFPAEKKSPKVPVELKKWQPSQAFTAAQGIQKNIDAIDSDMATINQRISQLQSDEKTYATDPSKKSELAATKTSLLQNLDSLKEARDQRTALQDTLHAQQKLFSKEEKKIWSAQKSKAKNVSQAPAS